MKLFKFIDAVDDRFDDYVDLFLKRYGGSEKIDSFILFISVSLIALVGGLQWVVSGTVLSDAMSLAFVAIFVSMIVMLSFVLLRIFGLVAVISVLSGLILTFM